ncbi:hypothetical protein HOF92_07835 [bacterium]|jgi:hypothetical protein|nr:hypothetical protein [bacterium]
MLRKILATALVCAVSLSAVSASSLLNFIPSVTGQVLEKDSGRVLSDASILVSFIGTRDGMLDENKKTFVIKELSAIADKEGKFKLPAAVVNILWGKFIGMQLKVSRTGFKDQFLNAVNMRAMGGIVGNFIIGVIDAQGDDFDTGLWASFKHATKVVRDNRVKVVYRAMFEEPIQLSSKDAPSASASSPRKEIFQELYKIGHTSPRAPGDSFVVNGPLGVIDVYHDASGNTQIRGDVDGTKFDSLGDSQIPITDRKVGVEDGSAYVQFISNDMTLLLVNNYGAEKMPAQLRDMLNAMNPGCVVSEDGKVFIPTAVVLITPAGLNPIAGYPEVISLR